jgi:nucleolar protein 12
MAAGAYKVGDLGRLLAGGAPAKPAPRDDALAGPGEAAAPRGGKRRKVDAAQGGRGGARAGAESSSEDELSAAAPRARREAGTAKAAKSPASDSDSGSSGSDGARDLFVSDMNEAPLGAAPGKKRRRAEAEARSSQPAAGAGGKSGRRALSEVEKAAEVEKLSRTLFVGNVPLAGAANLSKLSAAVKRAFAVYGAVESVRLRSVPVKSSPVPSDADFRVMRRVSAFHNNVDTEASGSCNAYVVYAEAAGVAAALVAHKAQPLEMHGHHLRCDTAGAGRATRDKVERDKSLFDRRSSVFVGNLPFAAGEESLRELFESKGLAVANVRIVRDRATNQGKGFGYVLFAGAESVPQALKVNGETFLKREIRVTHCEMSARDKVAKNPQQQQVPRKRAQGHNGGDKAIDADAARDPAEFQGAAASFSSVAAARKRMRKSVNRGGIKGAGARKPKKDMPLHEQKKKRFAARKPQRGAGKIAGKRATPSKK